MMKDLQEVTENMLEEDDHTGNIDINQSEENSASKVIDFLSYDDGDDDTEDDNSSKNDVDSNNSSTQGRGFTGEEFSLSDGSRCRDKVEVVEQIVYDEVSQHLLENIL